MYLYCSEIKPDIVTGRHGIHFSNSARRIRKIESFVIMFLMAFITIGVVAALYVLRDVLTPIYKENAQSIVSVMNTVQIIIFNVINTNAAIYLTTRENHRTDAAYADHLTGKLFVFGFINTFSSFFYIAFIAGHLEAAPGTSNPGDTG